MFRYDDELERIKAFVDRTDQDVTFGPAEDSDISYMQELLYPEAVTEFYKVAEPSHWVEINGAMLNTIADMWGENENTLPGDMVLPLGYLNIATSFTDDTYCIDLNSTDTGDGPAVVLISHNIQEGQEDEAVGAQMVKVAESFREFLQRFVDQKLPTDYEALKKAA